VNARTPDDLDQVARGNRLAFHLCLPFGFLPGVSVLFVGGTLFWAFHRARTEAAHYWARMIGWLAVLDLVVLGFIVLMAIGPFEIHEHEREGPKPPRMQIGIFFDQEAPEGQIVIGTVRPGLPAEGAGLEPGDIIVAVDGLDIFSRAELAGILGECDEGTAVELEIDRAGTRMDVQIVPVPWTEIERPGLFEADPSRPTSTTSGVLWNVLLTLPAYAVLVIAWLFARSRGQRATEFIGWMLVIFLAWHASSWLVATWGARTFGGYTDGAYLINMVVSMLTLAAAGGVAAWTMRRSWPDGLRLGGPILSTIGLGIVYGVCLMSRVAPIAYVLNSLSATNTLEFDLPTYFESLDSSGGTLLVFLLATVLIGPIAEELVYRGFILPWFASAIGKVPALIVTSIAFGLAHHHYGVFVLAPTLYGFVFGWARLRTGGILAPILLHVGVNLVLSSRLWL